MKASIMLLLCGVIIFSSTVCQAKVTEREIITSHKRVFRQTTDVGVSPQGRTSYVFKVESCDTAIITLSNIKYIDKSKGRYFLFYLGRNFNTQLSLLDSCFGCQPKAVLRRRVLDCNVFMPFWVQWNDLGSVWFGAGHKVGYGVLLSYTSPAPFSIKYSQLTSLAPPTIWKFLLDDKFTFEAPAADGSTTVVVREDEAVASFVYEITVRPLVNTLLTSCNDYFIIFGTQLLTKVPLDFESKPVHFLQMRTTEGNVSTTLTVIIEDVNDEVPEVVVFNAVRIPEELPVGSTFSGGFVVSDKDADDNLSFRLEGTDAFYLDVTPFGRLHIKERIDRDGPNGLLRLDNLTLVVKDSANHTTSRHLHIEILDVDDNKPKCSPDKVSVTVYPNVTKDVHVCSIQCSDLDVTSGANFYLTLDSNEDFQNVFSLSGTEVYADPYYLRRTYLIKKHLNFVLKLVVVYVSDTNKETTSSMSIIIKIKMEYPVVNEYPPFWISPQPLVYGRFMAIEISESKPQGTRIRCFLAYDFDESPLTYGIATILTDVGNQAKGTFTMDTRTGCMRTSSSLDADHATGGVHFYDLTIVVTDGKHTLSAHIRVLLQNINDNPPIFKKAIHHVRANFQYQYKPLVEVYATDYDDDSEVFLTLERGHHRFFKLKSFRGRWVLTVRPDLDPSDVIPPVIRITAKDNRSNQRTSQAVVIIEGMNCPVDLSENKSRHNVSDVHEDLDYPHTEVMLTSDHSTKLWTFVTSSVQTHMPFITSVHQDFQPYHGLSKPPIWKVLLLLGCVCLAVFNGIILALLMVVFACRDCSSSKEGQKRKDKNETTIEHKHPKMTRTIRRCPGKSSRVVCLLNIQEESRNATLQKIRIHRNDAHVSKNSSCEAKPPEVPKQSTSNAILLRELETDTYKNSPSKTSSVTKDIGIQASSGDDSTTNKHSSLHYMQNGSETSYFDIESVEVMKERFRDLGPLLKTNPFEVMVECTQDEPNSLHSNPFAENENHLQASSDDDVVHLADVSHDEQLSIRPGVDCGISLNEANSFDIGDDFETNGPKNVEYEHLDHDNGSGCDGGREETQDAYKCSHSSPEDIERPTVERCHDLPDTQDCRCTFRDDMDIRHLFHSSRYVAGPELSSKLFMSLLHQDRNSKVVEGDILEVNAEFLKSVIVYHGGRISDVERSLKRFPKRYIRTLTIVFLPRVIFLSFLSRRLAHNNQTDSSYDVVEIHTRFLHIAVVELEKHILAVCRAKGTVFAMRHFIMKVVCQNCRLVEVSLDFLTQLGKTEHQAYRFVDEHGVAEITQKGSFLVLLRKFLQFIRSGVSSERFPNCHQGSQPCQQEHAFHSEYVHHEIHHIDNMRLVSMASNEIPYSHAQFHSEQYSSTCCTSKYKRETCSYGNQCLPAYHSTAKCKNIGKSQKASSWYSIGRNPQNVGRKDRRRTSGVINKLQSVPFGQKQTGSRKVCLPASGVSGTYAVNSDPAQTVTKVTKGMKLPRATAAKPWTKKNKVKAWDKDVRDRLYGKTKSKTDSCVV